jgi:D-alanyl-D-alanine carboxypeptidase
MQRKWIVIIALISTIVAESSLAMGRTRCNFSMGSRDYDAVVSKYLNTPEDPGRVPAMALYLVDSQGQVVRRLFEANEHDPRAVASTQKILTAWQTLQARNIDEKVTYTSDDDWFDAANDGNPAKRRDGSRIQIGETATVREWVQTLLEQSSNSAAAALAKDSSGSHRAFVSRMNESTRAMIGEGDFDTYFQNPSGLTDTDERLRQGELSTLQHSTANNMARLLAKILASPEGRTIESLQVSNITGKGIFEKYGYTQAAGRTVVARWALPSQCRSSGDALVIAAFGSRRASLPALLEELEKRIGLAHLRTRHVLIESNDFR